MRVLGISGSLRRGSHNTALLRAAADLLPPRAELVEFERLGALRSYDADLDVDPAPAAGRAASRDRARRRAADRDPRVQRVDPGRSQERRRLGIETPPGQRVPRQARAGRRRQHRRVRSRLGPGRAEDFAADLERTRGQAAETERRTDELVDGIDGKKTAIREKARETKGEEEALDGFEFLSMAEAGELCHWEIVETMAEVGGERDVHGLATWAAGVQREHVEAVRRVSLALAAEEIRGSG